MVWPIYTSIALLLIEPSLARRRWLLGCLAVGVGVGGYLAWWLVTQPHGAVIRAGHIVYENDRTFSYTLALTYERLQNLRLATESYESAIRIAPGDYNVQNAYAVFLCNQGEFDKARKQFDRAIKVPVNDNSEITMTNAGVCMMQIPDAAAAEQYFRQALDRKPNYGEALLQLSLLKFSSEDYLGARAFLQRYLSSNVPTAGVLYLGVRIEEELGDERARTDYSNQILRQFPESREARSILESG